jgi:hypothetical protein
MRGVWGGERGLTHVLCCLLGDGRYIMEELSTLLDEISARYSALSALIDDRISYLNEMQSIMEEEIIAGDRDAYEDSSSDSDGDESDHDGVYYDDRHVHFDNVVVVIGDHIEDEEDAMSVDTLADNEVYHPGYGSEDSDDDTIVEDWFDPCRTPTYRDVIEEHADDLN